jgi:hypothetical protein
MDTNTLYAVYAVCVALGVPLSIWALSKCASSSITMGPIRTSGYLRTSTDAHSLPEPTWMSYKTSPIENDEDEEIDHNDHDNACQCTICREDRAAGEAKDDE